MCFVLLLKISNNLLPPFDSHNAAHPLIDLSLPAYMSEFVDTLYFYYMYHEFFACDITIDQLIFCCVQFVQ